MPFGNFVQGYSLGLQLRQARAEATKEEEKQRRDLLKLYSDFIKAGTMTPAEANKQYQERYGETGPFTPAPKLGEEVTKIPIEAGPAGDIATKEIRTGGVEVEPEAVKNVNLLRWMEEQKGEYPITPEMETEFITGVKKVIPPQKSAMLQEYDVWKEDPANAGGTLMDFFIQRTEALATGQKRTGVLAVWDEYKKEKPRSTFAQFLNIYPKRTGRAMALYERLARGMYGRAYYKLTQKQKMAVEDEVTRRQKQTGLGAIFERILAVPPASPAAPTKRFELIPED